MSRVQVLSAVQFGFAFFENPVFAGSDPCGRKKSQNGSVFFRKKQGRKNGRNLSKSPVFSCFLVRIDFDHTTWQGQEDSEPSPARARTWQSAGELPRVLTFPTLPKNKHPTRCVGHLHSGRGRRILNQVPHSVRDAKSPPWASMFATAFRRRTATVFHVSHHSQNKNTVRRTVLLFWGITTKPMHTALFFKIEPGYFVFG